MSTGVTGVTGVTFDKLTAGTGRFSGGNSLNNLSLSRSISDSSSYCPSFVGKFAKNRLVSSLLRSIAAFGN
jgi:hypothetical protein